MAASKKKNTKIWIPPVENPESIVPVIGQDSTFVCSYPGCSLRFTTKKNFFHHRKIHSSEPKPFQCKVPGCSSAYGRNCHLTRHMKQVHCSDGGDFQCRNDPGNCVASFSTLVALKNHVNRTHYHFTKPQMSSSISLSPSQTPRKDTKPKLFPCKICVETKPFLSRKEYCQHIHTQEHKDSLRNSSVCSHPNCGQTFVSRASLNAHLKTHLEVRSIYKCPHEPCPRTYYHAKNLNFHIRSTHCELPENYTCDICDKKLSTKQKLTKHRLNIHKDKTEQDKEHHQETTNRPRKYKLNRLKLSQCFSSYKTVENFESSGES